MFTSADLAKSVIDNARMALGRFVQPMISLLPTASFMIQGLAVNNATSQLQQIYWPWTGYLVGISAITEDGLIASMAATQLRVLVAGTEDLFILSSGSGAAYLNFATISGLQNGGMFPVIKQFGASTTWQAAVKTTANITADVAFHVVRTG